MPPLLLLVVVAVPVVPELEVEVEVVEAVLVVAPGHSQEPDTVLQVYGAHGELSVHRLAESQNPPNWVSQNPLAHWLLAEHDAHAAAPALPLEDVLAPVVVDVAVPDEDDELLAH